MSEQRGWGACLMCGHEVVPSVNLHGALVELLNACHRVPVKRRERTKAEQKRVESFTEACAQAFETLVEYEKNRYALTQPAAGEKKEKTTPTSSGVLSGEEPRP